MVKVFSKGITLSNLDHMTKYAITHIASILLSGCFVVMWWDDITMPWMERSKNPPSTGSPMVQEKSTAGKRKWQMSNPRISVRFFSLIENHVVIFNFYLIIQSNPLLYVCHESDALIIQSDGVRISFNGVWDGAQAGPSKDGGAPIWWYPYWSTAWSVDWWPWFLWGLWG